MVTETALSRERAKRCEWCARGIRRDLRIHLIPLPKPSHWIWQEPPYERHTCAAPAIEYLYEELAKERDELLNALIGMNVYFGSMAGGCEEEAEAAINECRRVIASAAARQPVPHERRRKSK